MRREAILDRITKDESIVMNAKDPLNLLGQYLSRDARFKNVGKGTWALRESGRVRSEDMDNGESRLPDIVNLNVYKNETQENDRNGQ